MIDIKEVAKEMTREEFLGEAKQDSMGSLKDEKSCPDDYELKSFDCTNDNSVEICEYNCRKCWEVAVKGIEFKDDLLESEVE